MRPDRAHEKLIPDHVKAEVQVQVNLPPEATNILRDLHNDRQAIGAGGFVALLCLVALTVKRLRGN